MNLPFSDEDLKPAVKNSLNKVKPMLALDGGDIQLIDIKNGIIYVQLQGGCIGCASSNQTIKYTVERQIRIDIHPELVVVNVPHGMETNLDNLR